MTLAFTVDAFAGAATTTDATPTAIAALAIAAADKTVTVFELEAFVVRQNTANPLVYYTRRVYTVTLVAGASSVIGNTTLVEHGDGSNEAALTAAGGGSANVAVTVTGQAATTYEWRVVLTRKTFAST